MKLLGILAGAMLAGPNATSPVTTALGVAIVEAIVADAGLGPEATHGPRAAGPVTLDRASFEDAYAWTFDTTAATALTQALTAEGYSFARLDTLMQSAVNTTGTSEYWISTEAIVAHLTGVTRYGSTAEAYVTYYYTYETVIGRAVCPRIIELHLRRTGVAEWETDRVDVVADC